MSKEFDGKAVLITGAGKGKGRLLAEEFVRRGASVAANDVSPVNLDGLVAQGHGKIKAYVEDVAKKVAAQSIVKQAEDDLGRIDILINHAAVEPRLALLDMDEWDWHRVFDVNLTGAFLMLQSVGRVMRAQGAGVIINLVTLNRPGLALPAPVPQAVSPRRAPGPNGAQVSEAEGSGHEAAYRASMIGLVELTRAAAEELSPYGIRVHAVGSGFAELHRADQSIPTDWMEAVFYLCRSSLNGQIVNVEE